eukprot:189006_1
MSTSGSEDDNKCIDISYDIITILISIADITTDVIVLISFFIEGRTTFFIISLIILAIAQMAYSVLFIVRYNVFDSVCQTVSVFILLLPFGSIVSFLVYLTEDPDTWVSTQMNKISMIDIHHSFGRNLIRPNQSKMTQWILRKGSKHIGFIIEAGIEALPQSLLQIIAIVYYKEAHYVSIVSIFLSMFSVMTKSLIFSQGIDIKTYIWTWFCIVTDFFGIFFTLTWVFYTDETIFKPQFLNHFSVIGQIWFYKVMISVAPFVIVAGLSFSIYHLPGILHDVWRDHRAESFCNKCGWTAFAIGGGGLLVIIATSVAFIAIEILCFAFLAGLLFAFGTSRWASNRKKTTNDKINAMIKFVSKPSICNCNGDRMLRMLAVNVFINEFIKSYSWTTPNSETGEYITKVDEEHGLEGLKQITYGDIRNNCGDESYSRDAKLFPGIWFEIKESRPSQADYRDCLCGRGGHHSWRQRFEDIVFVVGYWSFFIYFPVFVFCKGLQAVFPYIILGYLLYYGQFMNVHLFQLVMLITYIGLQFVWLGLGIMVCRIHWWLWHIYPGRNWLPLKEDVSVQKFIGPIDEWYEGKTRIPIIRKYVFNVFGLDIGHIIMDYYQNIKLEFVIS